MYEYFQVGRVLVLRSSNSTSVLFFTDKSVADLAIEDLRAGASVAFIKDTYFLYHGEVTGKETVLLEDYRFSSVVLKVSVVKSVILIIARGADGYPVDKVFKAKDARTAKQLAKKLVDCSKMLPALNSYLDHVIDLD